MGNPFETGQSNNNEGFDTSIVTRLDPEKAKELKEEQERFLEVKKKSAPVERLTKLVEQEVLLGDKERDREWLLKKGGAEKVVEEIENLKNKFSLLSEQKLKEEIDGFYEELKKKTPDYFNIRHIQIPAREKALREKSEPLPFMGGGSGVLDKKGDKAPEKDSSTKHLKSREEFLADRAERFRSARMNSKETLSDSIVLENMAGEKDAYRGLLNEYEQSGRKDIPEYKIAKEKLDEVEGILRKISEKDNKSESHKKPAQKVVSAIEGVVPKGKTSKNNKGPNIEQAFEKSFHEVLRENGVVGSEQTEGKTTDERFREAEERLSIARNEGSVYAKGEVDKRVDEAYQRLGISQKKEAETEFKKETKEVEKELKEMPEKEREKIGWGFKSWGFRVEEWKSRLVGNACAALAKEGESSTAHFFQSLAESYRKNEKTAKEEMNERATSGRAGLRLRNVGYLSSNILKYGRTIADIAGWTAGSPLRFAMLGAQIFSRGAEAAKGARFKNKELIEKTRIQDINEAEAEAWKIYEMAVRENRETTFKATGYAKGGVVEMKEVETRKLVSRKMLENAYSANLPEDLLNRLKKSEPGTAEGFLGRLLQKSVEIGIQHGKFDKRSYAKRLKEFDAMVSRYGTVDTLAFALKSAEVAGKAAIVGVSIETMYLLMQRLPEVMSHLSGFWGGGSVRELLETAEQPKGKIIIGGMAEERGGADLKKILEEATSKGSGQKEAIATALIGDTKVELPREPIRIGKLGPEGAIIDYLKSQGISTDKAGVQAHRMFLDFMKSKDVQDFMTEKGLRMGEGRWQSENDVYLELMKQIKQGGVELTSDGKMKLVDIEYIKGGMGRAIESATAHKLSRLETMGITHEDVEKLTPKDVRMFTPDQLKEIETYQENVSALQSGGVSKEDVEALSVKEVKALSKEQIHDIVEKTKDNAPAELSLGKGNVRIEDGKIFMKGNFDISEADIKKHLADDYLEKIRSTATNEYLATNRLKERAKILEIYTRALNELTKEGKGNTSVARTLRDAIKNTIETTEKFYGDVFK